MSNLVVSAVGRAGDVDHSSHGDADLHGTSSFLPCSISKTLPVILPAATLWPSHPHYMIHPLKSPIYPREPGDSYMYVYTSSFVIKKSETQQGGRHLLLKLFRLTV